MTRRACGKAVTPAVTTSTDPWQRVARSSAKGQRSGASLSMTINLKSSEAPSSKASGNADADGDARPNSQPIRAWQRPKTAESGTISSTSAALRVRRRGTVTTATASSAKEIRGGSGTCRRISSVRPRLTADACAKLLAMSAAALSPEARMNCTTGISMPCKRAMISDKRVRASGRSGLLALASSCGSAESGRLCARKLRARLREAAMGAFKTRSFPSGRTA